MKPTLIQHPLKRIHFNYKYEAALSDFERAFIERYKQLHDELAMIKDELLELRPCIRKVSRELKLVRKSFDTLHEKIRLTEQRLGLSPAVDIPKGEFRIKPGEINQVLNEFQTVRQEYWAIMVPMHNRFNDVYIRFTAFDDTVERFEKEYSQPLLSNPDSMEIDTNCFDVDMNEFRKQWMAITDMQDVCLDEYADWVKEQTSLVNDSTALYDRIKKLFQYISNIQKYNSTHRENDFGLN
ncbi:MAG TPA: hypothetical protein PLV32_12985 [Chitinophagaceae bacterium]|nr:hypothetical protein [Chitinophagaceae bacterium]